MLHFSDSLSAEQKQQGAEGAPAWLRIQFEREVLAKYFSLKDYQNDENGMFPIIKFSELFDNVTAHFKLRHVLNDFPKFLRSCKWFEFFDLIELFGDSLRETEEKGSQLIEDTMQEIGNEIVYDSDVVDEFNWYYFNSQGLQYLDYVDNVNSFFNTFYPQYCFSLEGRLIFIEVSPTELQEIKRYTEFLGKEPQTEIEYIFANVDKSLISDHDFNSLSIASSLFYQENFRECFCVLDGVIEPICNTVLIKHDIKPNSEWGLNIKAEKLEKIHVFPTGLKNRLQWVFLRNKTIHESEPEVERPFFKLDCLILFYVIKHLIT